jgi:hypothetical protein
MEASTGENSALFFYSLPVLTPRTECRKDVSLLAALVSNSSCTLREKKTE